MPDKAPAFTIHGSSKLCTVELGNISEPFPGTHIAQGYGRSMSVIECDGVL